MDTVLSNFEKVCRICMKFDQTFLSITSFKIIDMIIECASVKVWGNDELPNQICHTCFLQLQNAIHFKHLCESSDNKFRKIIQQNEFNLLNNESDINTVKDELFEDNDDDGFLIDIKEEDKEENSFENEKMKIVNDENNLKKSETNNILEIKIKDRSNLNKLQIRSKSEDSNDIYEDNEINENVIKRFTCEKCKKEFKKLWVLGQHMHHKHRAKAIKCNKCELKCYHLLHLKEHQELTHNPLNLTCSICNKVFKDIYKLKDHNKLIHSSKILQCKRCQISFNDKQTLKCHIKEVHSDEKHMPCHFCGKSILKKNLSVHLVIHKERSKINCDLCSKSFLRQETLKVHIRQVHENQIPKRNYLCNICGHASRSATKLRTHLLKHSNEKPYVCEHCDKTYRSADNLKRHISHAHLNQRKFQCTFCPHAFFEKRTFVYHVRRHTGEKPYKCEVCGKEFIRKYSLKIHMKMHTN